MGSIRGTIPPEGLEKIAGKKAASAGFGAGPGLAARKTAILAPAVALAAGQIAS